MGIKNRLVELMKEQGTNANDLAQKINATPSTIYSIIARDSNRIDIDLILKIAHALGVTADELLQDELSSDDRMSPYNPEISQRAILSENLKRIIQGTGKDIKTIASEIGIDRSVLNRWVNGKSLPNLNGLRLLADYFDCPVYELIDPIEDVLRADRISFEELDVIVCYRKASPGIREAVDKLLNLNDYRENQKW